MKGTAKNNEIDIQRVPTDNSYFVSKELLMTERTYKKDLELINVWFRDEVSKEENMPTNALSVLFGVVDPLYEFHCSFLRELEHTLATWEGRTGMPLQTQVQGIGDILFNKVHMTELYVSYVAELPSLLEQLRSAYCSNPQFERLYCEFEMQRVCYLPLTSFLLRPAHRLDHYATLLQKHVNLNGENHIDSSNCENVLHKLKSVTSTFLKNVLYSANFVKLMELQRDIYGIDNLTSAKREFLREGCLQKLSKKGYQCRMFFLFSDLLLYASRGAQHQFQVHGQLPLRGALVEATQPGLTHCFAIYEGKRTLMLAASCAEQKEKWLKDLLQTPVREQNNDYSRSCSSTEEQILRETSAKPYQHFPNTTVHVCWHRNTTVGKEDYQTSLLNYLSGYLLRKFKNSSGWQKLWVVFTNFCLFFYKSYQDDFPLASLPLIGYAVTLPTPQDNITKEYVFKLQFKNHIYFFRAESEYTFGRWIEVIQGATLSN